MVVHEFGTVFVNGGRIDEGASSYSGQLVGNVVSTGDTEVRGWGLANDLEGLAVGQRVELVFDPWPSEQCFGTVSQLSAVAEQREEWGGGAYIPFKVVPVGKTPPLIAGVNVRISSNPVRQGFSGQTELPSTSLTVAGEVYSKNIAVIAPPEVEDLWQLTITQVASDGAQVQAGDTVVVFDSADISKKLTEKSNALEEKRRAQDKLRLEIAQRQQTEHLVFAESSADAEKAQRKAGQPKTSLAAVDYKKLTIEARKFRAISEVRFRHLAAATRLSEADEKLMDDEVRQLSDDVARLQKAIDSLTIKAPRSGIFMMTAGWDGRKIDVGSQIWRGQSIASIPDPHDIAVRAQVDERDLTRITAGQFARISVDGVGELDGRVVDIGTTVHSKSASQPIPVFDVHIAARSGGPHLTPGESVRVTFGSKNGIAQP